MELDQRVDEKDKEFYIDWIISDYIPFENDGKKYYIASPAARAKFISSQIYSEFYQLALEEGLLTDSEIFLLLVKYDIWDEGKENVLKQLVDDVDTIKVNIYENYTRSASQQEWKRALRDTEKQISERLSDKHCWDMIGAEGVAQMAKQQYLLGASIYTARGKPYWKSEKCWELADTMTAAITRKLSHFKLSSDQYRELSKCAHWKSIWNIRKGQSVFGKPIISLSEPQRNLVYWSTVYDNIYKSPDCPSDEIVNDDDALDGWLITQRKKRERESNNSTINQLMGSEKIRDCEQIFIMTDEKDAAKVYEMNDIGGKIAINKRLKQIQKQGTVKEVNMVDRREVIQQQCASMFGQ